MTNLSLTNSNLKEWLLLITSKTKTRREVRHFFDCLSFSKKEDKHVEDNISDSLIFESDY